MERNNIQLQALQQSNEASRLEIQAQNNLQQDLSVSYSPFFTRGYNGVASSELVVSMGFDFPSQYVSRSKSGKLQNEAPSAGTFCCRPSCCAWTLSVSIRRKNFWTPAWPMPTSSSP